MHQAMCKHVDMMTMNLQASFVKKLLAVCFGVADEIRGATGGIGASFERTRAFILRKLDGIADRAKLYSCMGERDVSLQDVQEAAGRSSM